ncbi:MAG: phosphate ABC transporter substrate-binding protein, PhoT family [Bacteroidetes bacterium]|nr:MAG: phosphate ABC transporter substrate-binding protein, PhoT family [Bacteroidota bacterium]
MSNKLKFLFFILATVFASACSRSSDSKANKDSPVSGDILILCDESYKPLIQAQVETFHALYQYANIRVRYLPEADLFKEFSSNDSVRIAITARSLNKQEEEQFIEMKIIPRETKIAIDAIAFVLNKENPDTLLTYEQLKGILRGEIKSWKSIDPKTSLDSIQVVFDQNGSSTARFLKENFIQGESVPGNWYSIESNDEMINYVSTSPRSIGVIAVSWISDKDDPEVNEFLSKVNVVEISSPDTGQTTKEYFKPYQAYIALKKYPLTRDALIISREGRNGLGTGFASFVAGDQGQRLVRLMGMLPATMPVRIVKINQ